MDGMRTPARMAETGERRSELSKSCWTMRSKQGKSRSIRLIQSTMIMVIVMTRMSDLNWQERPAGCLMKGRYIRM
jgi:hypothetical protein